MLHRVQAPEALIIFLSLQKYLSVSTSRNSWFTEVAAAAQLRASTRGSNVGNKKKCVQVPTTAKNIRAVVSIYKVSMSWTLCANAVFVYGNVLAISGSMSATLTCVAQACRLRTWYLLRFCMQFQRVSIKHCHLPFLIRGCQSCYRFTRLHDAEVPIW